MSYSIFKMNFNIITPLMPMKHADQVFWYIQQNVLWHTSHFQDIWANTVEYFIITAVVKFHKSPWFFDRMCTQYCWYWICNIMFSQLHLWTFIAKVRDVTLISFDTSYLSFHQKSCVLWNGSSQNILWYPFSFKKTQISPKQTNERYVIRKLEILYNSIDFRYFRLSITKI
jgi:hypothetical protein